MIRRPSKKNWVFLFLQVLLLNGTSLFCQVMPANDSKLNYTSVYCQEEFIEGADHYKLILKSYDTSVINAPHEIIQKIPAFWVHGLAWGRYYQWEVRAFNHVGQEISRSQQHRFSIMQLRYQSFDEVKMNVLTNNNEKHAGGLIGVDYTRCFYNRGGERIWTIPDIPGLVDEKTNIRDLKYTKDNTVTFLTIPVPMEIDQDGNVLWKAPHPFVLGKDTITYHHEFEKTRRGTYMVLGDKKVWRKIPGKYSSDVLKQDFEIKFIDSVLYKRVLIAILLEFDKSGKLIWSWDANKYISDVDLAFKKNNVGMPMPATHANAFSENALGTHVYIGFRDLSRIVKVNKRTGAVEQSYGEKYPSGEAKIGDGLFKNQHDANITPRKTLLILNNNGALDPKSISSIMEISEEAIEGENILKWQFDLNFDTLSKGKSLNGGNVNELPKGNLLLCAGALNRIFEVNRNSEIVWDCFLFARGIKDTLWQEMNQYRSSWSKQFNRYYFMVKPEKTMPGGRVGVQIINTGNVSDNYSIQILDKSQRPIKVLAEIMLDAGSSETLMIAEEKGGKYIQVRSLSSRKVAQMLIHN